MLETLFHFDRNIFHVFIVSLHVLGRPPLVFSGCSARHLACVFRFVYACVR